MKQETLEEAVKNYCIKKYSVWVSNSDKSDDFINGAKWQQEQDKDKLELAEHFYTGIYKEKERMYSEEEVLKLVSDWKYYQSYDDTKTKVKFKEWFEQFKKK